MQHSSEFERLSGGEFPVPEALEPILENTLRYFDGEAAELYVSEKDRLLYLSDTDGSPVEEELRRQSFASRVIREEEVVEGEPGEAEEKLFSRHNESSTGINWSAGVPVYTRNGNTSGAFVVLGNRNESLTEQEERYLQNVSVQLSAHQKQAVENFEDQCRGDMYEMLVEEAYQFMGIITDEGNLVFANESSLELNQNELEDVAGVPFWETPWFDHSSELQNEIKEAVQQAKTGKFVQEDVSTVTSEGERLRTDFSITPVTGQNGSISYMIVEGRDITDRVKVERELKHANRRLRAIEENAPIGISLGDASGEVVTWNPRCEAIFEISRENAIGRTFPILSGIEEEDVREVLETIRSGETIQSREMRWKTDDGNTITLRYSLAPVQDDSGELCNIVGIFDDVTDVKETEEQLQEQERLFRKLIENIQGAYYLISLDNQKPVYLSSGIEEIWARPLEELQENRWAWLDSVHEQDRKWVRNVVQENPEETRDIQYRVVQQDGTVRWVHDSSYLIEDEEGEPLMVGGICEDITEHKAVQENLEKSLEEKETLFEELHHRVKNNLQIISSLMNLQLPRLPEEAKKSVQGLISQVHTIASLHETIHNSDHIAELKVESYIREIISRLISIYGQEGVEVELNVNDPLEALDLELAVPCGLIINELVSNALQYAFDGRSGRILVSLTSKAEEGGSGKKSYMLRVSDDGSGIPENVNLEDPEGFGLQLVKMMGEGELDGTCSVRRDDGTDFCITFPME